MATVAGFAFTHLDKLMYPEAGITKGDVLEFYKDIARCSAALAAQIVRRHWSAGLTAWAGPKAPHFWQKNLPDSYPNWIARATLPTEQGATVHYPLVNDLRTLLYLVNQGTLTFHVWLSRMQDLDRPDFVLFDLDPGSAGFLAAVAVAQRLRGILEAGKREAFLKTSGKSGLHIFVPSTEGGYDRARAWAEKIARQVVEVMPEQATVERSKAKRGRRVYVDVMQNVKGRHVVPPYVLRSTPTATVSTPLSWRELTASLEPTRFTLKTIRRRLARQRRDPMGELLGLTLRG